MKKSMKKKKEIKGKEIEASPKENIIPYINNNQKIINSNKTIINEIKETIQNIYIFKKVDRSKEDKSKKISSQIKQMIYVRVILGTYIFLFNFIYQVFSKSIFHERLLLNANQITLKVNGIGTHNILYSDKKDRCPSKIYINNVEFQKLNPCYQIVVNTFDSIIKLEWDYTLIDTSSLFYDCKNITEINLSNFNFSLVSDMTGMFHGCTSLKKVDLSNINKKGLLILKEMFYNCTSLTSIDLSNFDASIISNIDNIFYNCENLEYINLKNFKLIGEKKDVFSGISKNAVICLNSSKTPKIDDLMEEIPCVVVSCEENWRSVQQKIIIDSDECVSQCDLITNYVEYHGKCYQSCPENTNLCNGKCYSKDELCDQNCKTCYPEKDKEFSSNCSSCYSNQYLQNGKCVDECKNGNFSDELDSSIKKCKCDLIKCKECTLESLSNDNSCISCNEEKGYYPKFNNTNNTFMECYNGNISGYYFDISDKYYKECFKTCETCKKKGNKDYHNCISCKNYYNHEINISETLNCYLNNTNLCSANDFEEGLCQIENEDIINFLPIWDIFNPFSGPNFKNGSLIIANEMMDKIFEPEEDLVIITLPKKNSKSNDEIKIDLGECEEIIRKEYNLSYNESISLKKIKSTSEGYKIPKLEYEVYIHSFNGNISPVSLSLCKNASINIFIPLELSLYSFDLDNFNLSHYYEICYDRCIFNDTILPERKKEFIDNEMKKLFNDTYKEFTILNDSKLGENFSSLKFLLDNNTYNKKECEVIDDIVTEVNSTSQISCTCNLTTEFSLTNPGIDVNLDKLIQSLKNMKNFEQVSNINVLKCIRLIFKIDAFKSNYANIIMVAMHLYYFINLILFYCKDYSYLKQILDVITYYKLNPNEAQKIMKKEKQQGKKENLITQKSHKNMQRNKTKTETKEKNEKTENISNPVKKRKKRNNNLNKNKSIVLAINSNNIKMKKKINNNLNNRNQTSGTAQNIVNKDKSLINNLNEDQLYDILKKINKYTISELNDLDYKNAKKKDERTYFKYYISLVFTNHLLFYSFYPSFDYNSRIIKIYLFFYNFTVLFFVNALFFRDETMKIAKKEKHDLVSNIPKIIYSALISGVINGLNKKLELTESRILDLKQKSNKDDVTKNKDKTIIIIKIKFIVFFLLNLLVMVFIWIYLASFCAVYKNTQIHLIKDTLISFGFSMTYPPLFYFIPGLFRMMALKADNKNKKYIYKLSKYLQFAVSLL